MSDIMMSSYSRFGAEPQSSTDEKPSLDQLLDQSGVTNIAASFDDNLTRHLSVQPLADVTHMRDKTVAELAIRRLGKEIEHANAELVELERTVRHEFYMPSVREWLLPLMAIGLALSFYGSFASANSAEMGATGLMLLWSLSAFWFIHTREKRLEMAREANRAEIEIWSSRIEELQKSIEQNQHAAEIARPEQL